MARLVVTIFVRVKLNHQGDVVYACVTTIKQNAQET